MISPPSFLSPPPWILPAAGQQSHEASSIERGPDVFTPSQLTLTFEMKALSLLGSPLTAGIIDLRLARKIVSVMETENEVRTNPAASRNRRIDLHLWLDRVTGYGHVLETADVQNLLATLATPQTLSLLSSWSAEEFDVQWLEPVDFRHLARQRGLSNSCETAFYDATDEESEKDRIFLSRPEGSRPDEDPRIGVYERVLALLHEWEHWRHFNGRFEGIEAPSHPLPLGHHASRQDRLVAEIMADLEEYRLCVSLGDFSQLHDAARNRRTLVQEIAQRTAKTL